MPEEIEKTGDHVGSVSANRYAQIVAELRKLVETSSRIQFTIGDYALEVEPMREAGGQSRSDALCTVRDSLFRLAEDIGLSCATVDKARWSDLLRRPAVVAQVKAEDRVRVVEELTRDEHVAARVTTGMLRRPDVAFRAMSDDTARHQVNHAQAERDQQAREHFEDTSPVAPAVRSIDRSVELLDLVTACHSFVAAGRIVPAMRDRQLGDDEGVIVHETVARVRATPDWIETAVDTGKVDVDGELARLLQGE